VRRGTKVLFSLDLGGDEDGGWERLSFDIDVIVVASVELRTASISSSRRFYPLVEQGRLR
jgi:hypothetical protein